jgi:hypothetical protein
MDKPVININNIPETKEPVKGDYIYHFDVITKGWNWKYIKHIVVLWWAEKRGKVFYF